MAHFLVEFRMHGYAKEYAKGVVYSVAKRFGVRGVTRGKVVPHISLYGPGRTDEIRRVISAIEKVGKRYTLVPFKIKGFGSFDNGPKVIYFGISPSYELEKLRLELSQELKKVSSCQPWDSRRNHAFHSTIAFRDIDTKFELIKDYLRSLEQPNINQHLLRLTLLGRDSRIVCEYDLVLKKMLSRREALNNRLYRKSVNKLRELQGLPEMKLEAGWFAWLKRVFGWPKQ